MTKHWLAGFELIVLLALLRLADRAYGVTIRLEIAKRTGRDVSIGAVYATLNRLESKGYVWSRLGDPTPERGGRSRRYFTVTQKGMRAVRNTYHATERLVAGLDQIRSFA